MTSATNNNQALGDDSTQFLAFQKKVRGTNINEQTLLATDYLNHFNEIVMLLEMIPDMPELLDDAKEWRPKGYQEHLLDSTFAEKELAAEAYNHVPSEFREPFEKTVSQLNSLIETTIERIEHDMEGGNTDLMRENAVTLSQIIQRLMDVAGGIINGHAKTFDQSEIDDLIG
ncbi:MAG: hypothetical protein HQ504_07205 [Rhodospirillaceae bacterium]|nr:hypothetical protein [Rhodospirillaceae bacterium]